nr:mediator of RNA polymerase II transcription subunit 14 [Tanacetum cinerariifolium]
MGNYGEICADIQQGPDMDVGKKDLAADSMFFMYEGLQQARATIYDVSSAIEILLTGTYKHLPKCTEDLGIQSTLNDKQHKPVLKKLDTLIRLKLLETALPKEFSEVKISDGTVLVGETSVPVKLEETRRFVLRDDLERKMAASDTLFTTLDEFCVPLIMKTIIRQV